VVGCCIVATDVFSLFLDRGFDGRGEGCLWTVQNGFWGNGCVLLLSATFDVGVWRPTDCVYDHMIEMEGVVVFRHVVFIFCDCSGCLVVVVFFEEESVFADDWVWVVFLVEDV
jgi:hypothetical protein